MLGMTKGLVFESINANINESVLSMGYNYYKLQPERNYAYFPASINSSNSGTRWVNTQPVV